MTATAPRRDPGECLVAGEFPFTQADFDFLARTIHQLAGITLTEAKANLVYSRVAKRLRALGLESFADYCAMLETPRGEAEVTSLLTALTTNVTRFFREPHHFDHLRREVIAPAADALLAGGRMRLWSAACSSGQEPYSMALMLLSILPQAPQLDVKILATDIDPAILRQAQAGEYTDEQVEPIPPDLCNRWMERVPGPERKWRAGPVMRSLVTFKPLNLIEPWPVRGPFDAIFCRNVVIYFDEPTQERVWSRFAPLLGAKGRLYIGHSERVGSGTPQLVTDGLTIYRPRSGDRA